MEKPLEITVGGAGPYDPAALSTDCLIPSKKGLDLVVVKRDTGPLKTSEIQILTAGGFRLTAGTFLGAEVYFVYDAGVSYATSGGTYSNGFNFTQVIAALFGRLGWRQGTIDDAPVANAANATSRSGRYFNDFHALCTLNNVKALLEDPHASDAEINAFLESFQRSAILRSLTAVCNEPESIEIGLDFDREGELNDRPVASADLFVYRRITIARSSELAVQIDTVGLLFDGDVTFTLYLFQEGKKAPIWSGEVDAVANEKTVVVLPDVVLTYLGANHLGGAYYLGYFQQDLGAVKAIDESRICFNTARTWRVEPMQSARTGAQEFNRTILQGSPWSGGLQLQLSAFKDWTTLIVKKANLFDELVGLQMAVLFIELALMNVRNNPTERQIKDQLAQLGLWQQLDGVTPGVPDAPKIASFRDRIAQEARRIKKSFIPSPRGINYTVGNDC